MLSVDEAEVGKRIRLVREEYGVSQRLAGQQMGLSRAQLKRIELGEVAVRPAPALMFCEFTNRSPLWLAFGEPQNRYGFFWTSTPKTDQRGWQSFQIGAVEWRSDPIISEHTTFLQMMRKHKDRFMSRAADFLATSDAEARWRLGLREPRALASDLPNVNYQLTNRKAADNVSPMNLQNAAFWPGLRERIRKLVRRRGAKAALARDIGISRQAVNALLRKKYVPSAEFALRLEKWVELAEAKQKKSAGSVSEARPARTTRARRSKH